MSSGKEYGLYLIALGLLNQEEETKEITRENYELVWNPDNAIATAQFVGFNYQFTDGKKRYLRAVSLQNRQTQCLVQVWLRDRVGVDWRQDLILASEYTHTLVPASATQKTTVFTWNGDIPFRGGVRVHCYDCAVDDQVFCVILYEEKI